MCGQGQFPTDPVRFGTWTPGNLLGRKVLYPAFAGETVLLGDDEFKLLSYDDIYAMETLSEEDSDAGD